MKLQSKLFILMALVSILPLILILGLVVSQSAQRLESQAKNEINAALANSVRNVRNELAADRAAVLALATVPSFRTFLQADAGHGMQSYHTAAERLERFMLDYQLRQPSIQAIRVISPDGKVLVKIKEGKIIKAEKRLPDGRSYVLDQSASPFFLWARAHALPGHLAMSRFEMGQMEPGKAFCPPMIRYMTPLMLHGRVTAYLAVNFWGKRYDSYFDRIIGPEQGKVFVAEANNKNRLRDGVLLYYPDRDVRFADQTGKPYRVATLLGDAVWTAMRSQSADVLMLPKKEELLFFRKFEPGGMDHPTWIVAAQVSRAALLAPVVQMREGIIGIAVLLLAMSLILSRWLAKQLADPIQSLAAKLKGYADGERDFDLPVHRRDELGYLAQAFNYMVQRLEATAMARDRAEMVACQAAKLATVGELAAGLGHEINNPLNNILGLAKLMERESGEALPEWARHDLDTMRRECERAAEIVQGLLNFSRQMAPQYGEFSLRALLDEAFTLLRRKAQASGVRLLYQMDGDHLLHADRNQILQVLINVLLNAIQASPVNGRVRVSALLEGNQLRIHVEDEGSGVPQEYLGRIFDPFFSTKGEGQGTGLGLSVSFGIVRRHQGDIEVDRSRDLGGARVSVRLPLRAPGDREQESGAVPSVQEVLRHVG